jgi:triosephosphate isomerase
MIIANWKMNGSKEEVDSWLRFVSSNISPNKDSLCIFCPPSCYLDYSSSLIKEISSSIKLGSQNINFSFYDEPLTGGISATMLSDIGVDYVLIGHSEQRELLAESSIVLGSKIKKALDEDLSVIFCVGESLEIKNNNETELFLSEQLDALGQQHYKHENKIREITVAYEPIWAIGSGLNADIEYIQEIHKFIKQYLKDHLGFGILDIYTPVLYGGSVNLDNYKEIYSSTQVDGLLIGGASLDSETFTKIYNM